MHELPRKRNFFTPAEKRAVNQVVLNLEILMKKLRRIRVIGMNTAHFRRRVENVCRLLLRQKLADGFPVQQFQFRAGPANQLGKSSFLQFSPNRASHQPAVSGNKNFGVFIHRSAIADGNRFKATLTK